jgi:hypothetical protein
MFDVGCLFDVHNALWYNMLRTPGVISSRWSAWDSLALGEPHHFPKFRSLHSLRFLWLVIC